jgi:putative ABC transport system permease protein
MFGLKFRSLVAFYRWRLRKYAVQEILSGTGIAIGVALVFAVLVANSSITASAEELLRGTTANATIQVSARGPEGLDENLVDRVDALSSVQHAAPALMTRVLLKGPDATRAIQLIGVTPAVAELNGQLTSSFSGFRLTPGLILPSGVADSLGVSRGGRVRAYVDGRVGSVPVSAVVGESAAGALASSLIAISYLAEAQAITGKRDKVSQILVVPRPGAQADAERQLRRIVGGSATVSRVDAELAALRQAAKPNNQSTSLFAAIGAIVGFLLAVSSMLLTIPERRHFITDLRLQGFSRRKIVVVLAFEAAVLGLCASIVGVLLGAVLAQTVLQEEPGYLVFGFALGEQQIISPVIVAAALAGGVAATLLASVPPAFDLFSRRSLGSIAHGHEEIGEAISTTTATRLAIVAAVLTAVTAIAAALVPATTILGGVALALAAALVLPTILLATVSLTRRLSLRQRGSVWWFASLELRAAPIRSVALAAVAALAVYGSVAVQGARSDLERGLQQGFVDYLTTADVWVTSASDGFQAESFRPMPQLVAALGRDTRVKEVRTYQGQYLDDGDRRIWMIARPAGDHPLIPPSQILEGDAEEASQRIAGPDRWATVSNTLADAKDLSIGDTFTLPSPTGEQRLRVAAVTTNLGWGPGAVILNQRDYRQGWATRRPVALEVDFADGVSAQEGKAIVDGQASAGIVVQTSTERVEYVSDIMRQGLARLTQISTLLLIAAGFAVAFAMGASIWQRRPRLASLKVQGLSQWQLWRALLAEIALVLFVGCLTGVVFGIFGHLLASRWLALTTGFPAPFAAFEGGALGALALIAVVAFTVAAIPGYIVTRVPARATFQE